MDSCLAFGRPRRSLTTSQHSADTVAVVPGPRRACRVRAGRRNASRLGVPARAPARAPHRPTLSCRARRPARGRQRNAWRGRFPRTHRCSAGSRTGVQSGSDARPVVTGARRPGLPAECQLAFRGARRSCTWFCDTRWLSIRQAAWRPSRTLHGRAKSRPSWTYLRLPSTQDSLAPQTGRRHGRRGARPSCTLQTRRAGPTDQRLVRALLERAALPRRQLRRSWRQFSTHPSAWEDPRHSGPRTAPARVPGCKTAVDAALQRPSDCHPGT